VKGQRKLKKQSFFFETVLMLLAGNYKN